mgnify:CR=1 FL=1
MVSFAQPVGLIYHDYKDQPDKYGSYAGASYSEDIDFEQTTLADLVERLDKKWRETHSVSVDPGVVFIGYGESVGIHIYTSGTWNLKDPRFLSQWVNTRLRGGQFFFRFVNRKFSPYIFASPRYVASAYRSLQQLGSTVKWFKQDATYE